MSSLCLACMDPIPVLSHSICADVNTLQFNREVFYYKANMWFENITALILIFFASFQVVACCFNVIVVKSNNIMMVHARLKSVVCSCIPFQYFQCYWTIMINIKSNLMINKHALSVIITYVFSMRENYNKT